LLLSLTTETKWRPTEVVERGLLRRHNRTPETESNTSAISIFASCALSALCHDLPLLHLPLLPHHELLLLLTVLLLRRCRWGAPVLLAAGDDVGEWVIVLILQVAVVGVTKSVVAAEAAREAGGGDLREDNRELKTISVGLRSLRKPDSRLNALANEQRGVFHAGILAKPTFRVVVLKWRALVMLEKQKAPFHNPSLSNFRSVLSATPPFLILGVGFRVGVSRGGRRWWRSAGGAGGGARRRAAIGG
jgi:hypothetical protein